MRCRTCGRRVRRKFSLQQIWLDAVIGWNEGAAERLERRASIARRRELRARDEYRYRYTRRRNR